MNQLEKTRCLSVTFHMPGNIRRGNLASVETTAAKTELKLGKRIFRSDAYKEAQKIAIRTRQWIESRSVPSPLKAGTYLIPESMIATVEERLQEAKEKFDDCADRFASEYPKLVEDARERLGDQYNPSNYLPEKAIRARFWMERLYLNFTPAGDIDQDDDLKRAIDDIKAALRCGLLDLVEKLSGMLGEKKDGKKRAVTDKSLKAFDEWVNILPDRLVVDDDELKSLVAKAKEIMEGKTRNDLRDMGAVRSETKKGLEQVGEQLRGLLKDMPNRAFTFDDDDV